MHPQSIHPRRDRFLCLNVSGGDSMADRAADAAARGCASFAETSVSLDAYTDDPANGAAWYCHLVPALPLSKDDYASTMRYHSIETRVD
jgi:hypothetical protein